MRKVLAIFGVIVFGIIGLIADLLVGWASSYPQCLSIYLDNNPGDVAGCRMTDLVVWCVAAAIVVGAVAALVYVAKRIRA
jgi:hypothetical protein